MSSALTLVEISNLSAYELASMADCGSPDRSISAGAKMLDHVRDEVIRAIDEGRITLDDFNDDGQLNEIADGAPSIYTMTMWAQFIDLAAWQEEPEFGDWPEDLGKAAAIALYQVAERLAYRLCEAWKEGWTCLTCRCGPDERGCDTTGCANPGGLLAGMVAERLADMADEPAEVPVEAVLTVVVDPVLTLIDQVEAREMGVRVTRARFAHEDRVNRFRRRVWMVAGLLAVIILTVGVVLTV